MQTINNLFLHKYKTVANDIETQSYFFIYNVLLKKAYNPRCEYNFVEHIM